MHFTQTLNDDFIKIQQTTTGFNFLESKRVLITGANGFIASYLINYFLFLNSKCGAKIKVIALLRNKNKLDKQIAANEAVEIVEQDICQPITFNYAVDIILHTASYACPSFFETDPVGTSLPNTLGTHFLLEYAKNNPVQQFVFFSTTGVYGHNPAERYPLTETDFGSLDCATLGSCYLESKRMGENLCISYHKQHGIPVKIIRPAITFGPGIDLKGNRSYEDFIGKILKGEDIELLSDGSAIRNFCYISDFISGLLTVISHGSFGEAYNVATDEDISISHLAEKLTADVFKDKQLKVIYKSSTVNKALRTEFNRTTVDINKTKALGWELQVSTLKGFEKTVKHYNELRNI